MDPRAQPEFGPVSSTSELTTARSVNVISENSKDQDESEGHTKDQGQPESHSNIAIPDITITESSDYDALCDSGSLGIHRNHDSYVIYDVIVESNTVPDNHITAVDKDNDKTNVTLKDRDHAKPVIGSDDKEALGLLGANGNVSVMRSHSACVSPHVIVDEKSITVRRTLSTADNKATSNHVRSPSTAPVVIEVTKQDIVTKSEKHRITSRDIEVTKHDTVTRSAAHATTDDNIVITHNDSFARTAAIEVSKHDAVTTKAPSVVIVTNDDAAASVSEDSVKQSMRETIKESVKVGDSFNESVKDNTGESTLEKISKIKGKSRDSYVSTFYHHDSLTEGLDCMTDSMDDSNSETWSNLYDDDDISDGLEADDNEARAELVKSSPEVKSQKKEAPVKKKRKKKNAEENIVMPGQFLASMTMSLCGIPAPTKLTEGETTNTDQEILTTPNDRNIINFNDNHDTNKQTDTMENHPPGNINMVDETIVQYRSNNPFLNITDSQNNYDTNNYITSNQSVISVANNPFASTVNDNNHQNINSDQHKKTNSLGVSSPPAISGHKSLSGLTRSRPYVNAFRDPAYVRLVWRRAAKEARLHHLANRSQKDKRTA